MPRESFLRKREKRRKPEDGYRRRRLCNSELKRCRGISGRMGAPCRFISAHRIDPLVIEAQK
jgi:hypothetical protein